MTDSRFPERWLTDRRFAKISDAAFRLFVSANAWTVSNRTDGAVTRDDLQLLPRHVPIACAHELVEAGFWIEVDDGWVIAGYTLVQTTRAQLEAAEHARMLDRERKARSRARNGVSPDPEPVHPDVTPDVTMESTGQARARTGHDRRSTRSPDSSSKSELEISAGAHFDWASVGAEEPRWAEEGDGDYPCWAEWFAICRREYEMSR